MPPAQAAGAPHRALQGPAAARALFATRHNVNVPGPFSATPRARAEEEAWAAGRQEGRGKLFLPLTS